MINDKWAFAKGLAVGGLPVFLPLLIAADIITKGPDFMGSEPGTVEPLAWWLAVATTLVFPAIIGAWVLFNRPGRRAFFSGLMAGALLGLFSGWITCFVAFARLGWTGGIGG